MDSKTAQSDAEVVKRKTVHHSKNNQIHLWSIKCSLYSKPIWHPNSTRKKASCSKKSRKSFKFEFKGNRKQFKLNAQLDHILSQIEVNLNEPQEVRKLVAEGRQLIKKRLKLIKLTDRSKDGWLVVQEYESDELASNSEDKKKIQKAKLSAQKKRKESKASSGNASKKFKSASDVYLFCKDLLFFFVTSHVGMDCLSIQPSFLWCCIS